MSETAAVTNAELEHLDALALSALVSSRVCHDLINPVGAFSSGLEVLDNPTMDGSMRDAAMDLVRASAEKATAMLSYARLAYGAAGGYGAQISLTDAREALAALCKIMKVEVNWGLGDGLADKNVVKTLMIVGFTAAECAPRGGALAADGDVENFAVAIRSDKKLYLQDGLASAFDGNPADLTPKFAPAYIASRLAAECGGAIKIDRGDGYITFSVTFRG